VLVKKVLGWSWMCQLLKKVRIRFGLIMKVNNLMQKSYGIISK